MITRCKDEETARTALRGLHNQLRPISQIAEIGAITQININAGNIRCSAACENNNITYSINAAIVSYADYKQVKALIDYFESFECR